MKRKQFLGYILNKELKSLRKYMREFGATKAQLLRIVARVAYLYKECPYDVSTYSCITLRRHVDKAIPSYSYKSKPLELRDVHIIRIYWYVIGGTRMVVYNTNASRSNWFDGVFYDVMGLGTINMYDTTPDQKRAVAVQRLHDFLEVNL